LCLAVCPIDRRAGDSGLALRADGGVHADGRTRIVEAGRTGDRAARGPARSPRCLGSSQQGHRAGHGKGWQSRRGFEPVSKSEFFRTRQEDPASDSFSVCLLRALRAAYWSTFRAAYPSETPRSLPRKLGNPFRALTPSRTRTTPRTGRLRHAVDFANSKSGSTSGDLDVAAAGGLVPRRAWTPSQLGHGTLPEGWWGRASREENPPGGRGRPGSGPKP
jgi:hypothetical protein